MTTTLRTTERLARCSAPRTRKLIARRDGLFELEIKGLGRRSPALTRIGMLQSIDRLLALGELTERNALALKGALSGARS